MSRYHEVYRSRRENHEAFWAKAAAEIDWYEPWRRTFETAAASTAGSSALSATPATMPSTATWKGRGGQTAIVHDSPVTGSTHHSPMRELRDEVAHLRGACSKSRASRKGDRVIIYMPMVPRGGHRDARLRPHRRRPFGGVRRLCRAELATRIDDAKPQARPVRVVRHRAHAVVEYKPLLDEAFELAAHKPEHA